MSVISDVQKQPVQVIGLYCMIIKVLDTNKDNMFFTMGFENLIKY